MTSSRHGQRTIREIEEDEGEIEEDEGEFVEDEGESDEEDEEEFMRILQRNVIIAGNLPTRIALQSAFNINNDNDLTVRFNEYRGLTTEDQRITFYNEMVRLYGIRLDDPRNNARGIVRHKRKSSKRKSSKRKSSKRKSSKRKSSKRKSSKRKSSKRKSSKRKSSKRK